MAGYSEKPLDQKLGLQPGQRAAWIGLPSTLSMLPLSHRFSRSEMVTRARELSTGPFDMVHLFTMSRAVLAAELPLVQERLASDGMIWVSWPKKSAKIPTDVTGDVVRQLALTGVLVDVKVCAVDAIWSGLKLVIRKEAR